MPEKTAVSLQEVVQGTDPDLPSVEEAALLEEAQVALLGMEGAKGAYFLHEVVGAMYGTEPSWSTQLERFTRDLSEMPGLILTDGDGYALEGQWQKYGELFGQHRSGNSEAREQLKRLLVRASSLPIDVLAKLLGVEPPVLAQRGDRVQTGYASPAEQEKWFKSLVDEYKGRRHPNMKNQRRLAEDAGLKIRARDHHKLRKKFAPDWTRPGAPPKA